MNFDKWEMFNVFINSFCENFCAEDALKLKWEKTTHE